jgi:hypothetical protein
VTQASNPGHRWLDSLARWAVRGEASGPPASGAEEVTVVASGTTRRTALRRVAGAAGAVALTGRLALADPPPAGAAETGLSRCQSESFKSVFADFQACVKNPLEELEDTTELLRIYESGPLPKNPSKLKRAKKVLAALRRRRDHALTDIEFCNTLFNRERAEGEDKCHANNKPTPETGNGGATTIPGCERGYLLCNEYCCNTANAYCQGCGTPTCCRLGGDCCPNEH